MISTVVQNGIQGYQRATQSMEQSAAKIQGLSAQPDPLKKNAGINSIEQPLIELKLYEMSAKASTKVIEHGDELLGTLIDTTA